MLKHLPWGKSRMLAGAGSWIVTLFVLLLPLQAAAQSSAESQEVFDPNPLQPANTSSPRDTLQSFNTNITEGYRAYVSNVPEDVLLKLLRRVSEAFDFSRLPARGRAAKETETYVALKEILDRIELPPVEAIPGVEEVADTDDPIASWTIPNTRITIAKVVEGPRAGEFLFTAETVARLRDFYEDVKHLPYKPGAIVGLYEGYKHRPGRMVPRSLATALPQWSKTVVLGEAVWQWLGFAIVAVAAFLIICLLVRWGRQWDKRHASAGTTMRFGLPLSMLAGIGIFYACRYAFISVLRLRSGLGEVLSIVLWALIFAGVGWLILLVTGRIADAVNEARRVKEGSIDSQLVRIILRLLSVVILVILFIFAADFFGIPLTPVVASLGVGGLAIALAVRPTLENIIGGLTLFADKPVRIGDFCRFGDNYAAVEQIGLRSTRLRRLDDTLVTVPNADFSQRELINYTQRNQRLYRMTLGLRYETKPEQLRYVIANLREMLLGHPKVSPDWLHVRFHGFGAYSLDIELFAYIRTKQWLEYRAIREDINLRIMDIVKDAGTGFAFPSQTAYLGRDTGLDAEQAREAEKKVEEWRSAGQLPFPEFDKNLRWEKEDILDYPPVGSPGATWRAGLSSPPPEPQASTTESQPAPPAKPKRTP